MSDSTALNLTSLDAFASSLSASLSVLLREAFEQGYALAVQRERDWKQEEVKGEAQAELFDELGEQAKKHKRNGRRLLAAWTEERAVAAKWLLDTGATTTAVVSLINRLPGPKIVSQDVWNMARRDGWRQPIRRREKQGKAA